MLLLALLALAFATTTSTVLYRRMSLKEMKDKLEKMMSSPRFP